MSDKPVGDPILHEQPRAAEVVDHALEAYAGWCRGCHHPVRSDAEGRRRCPECGLDAAPVLEAARRLRERPRAARWLAWSLIALGAALWIHAWQGLLAEALFDLRLRWDPPNGPWADLESMIAAMRTCIDVIMTAGVPLVVFLCVASIMAGHRATRVLSLKILLWGISTLVAIAFAYSVTVVGWPVHPSQYDAWVLMSATSSTSIQAESVWIGLAVKVLSEPGAMLVLMGCCVVLVRRWRMTPARRLLSISVALLVAAAIAWITWTATWTVIKVDTRTGGRGAGLITDRIVEVAEWMFSIQSQAWFVWAWRAVETGGFLLLGWLFVATGHGLVALASWHADSAHASARKAAHRRERLRWFAGLTAGVAALTVIFVPVIMNQRQHGWRDDMWLVVDEPLERSTVVFAAVLQLLLMLPLIAGAVCGSWRFALLLAGVSIVTAALGVGASLLVWG